MRVQHFSRLCPPIVLETPLPADAVLLVFDTTLVGYKQAAQWLQRTPPGPPLYRLVIPYSDQDDVGDHLFSGSQSPVLGTYDAHPMEARFRVVPIWQGLEDRDPRDWPFPSRHALLDFQCAIQYLEDQALLRDAFLGISRVQAYMLELPEGDEVVAMASVKFGITLTQSRRQWEMLELGNYPARRYRQMGEAQIMPYVLLNGPYPLHPELLRRAIIEYIDKGVVFNQWGRHAPWCKGSRVTGNTCHAKQEGGWIVAPPYGVGKDEFQRANAGWFRPTEQQPFRFLADAPHHGTAEMTWDPVFLGKRFETIDAYFESWVREAEMRMGRHRGEMEAAIEKEAKRADFLRGFVVGSTFPDEYGARKLCYVDEPNAEKEARVMADYGHVDFLDTPIRMLDTRSIDFTRFEPAPSCGRDLWVKYLHQFTL